MPFILLLTLSFIAVRVPAAVSAATADGKLPRQCRTVPGPTAVLCHQTFSPHSTLWDAEPH